MELVTLEEIKAARERIRSTARYTPLLEAPWPGTQAPEAPEGTLAEG